ncbi:MAG: universal stress protein [Chlorobiales bacterium]|nr:universal stress protein [Chlorobiales bacterium]
MNENQTPNALIQRILIAIDGSPHSQAALEAAVEMARLLQAELTGIFVEDINLLRLAELPFAREVCRHRATSEKMTLSRIERQLRLQAKEAQQALQKSAERRTVQYSFRVVRGPVSEELLRAALETDLLALGRTSRPLSQHSHLGSTAKTAIAQARSAVLLMRPDLALKHPVAVFYEGSEGSNRALAVAAEMAKQTGHLHVLIWAETDGKAREYQQEIGTKLQGTGLSIEYQRLAVPDSTHLSGLLRVSGIGLLVLSDLDSKLAQETIHVLLEELDYPVLLVRQSNK